MAPMPPPPEVLAIYKKWPMPKEVQTVYVDMSTNQGKIRELQTKIKFLEHERDMWRDRALSKGTRQ